MEMVRDVSVDWVVVMVPRATSIVRSMAIAKYRKVPTMF